MKFSRRDAAEPSVNLTPLIDVVFLLLIFFMVSTRFVDDRSLPLELPAAAQARADIAQNALSVRVDAAGRYRVDGRTVTAAGIGDTLDRLHAAQPGRPLRVRADAAARHAAVVAVLDAAASAGFARVDIATRSKE